MSHIKYGGEGVHRQNHQMSRLFEMVGKEICASTLGKCQMSTLYSGQFKVTPGEARAKSLSTEVVVVTWAVSVSNVTYGSFDRDSFVMARLRS